MDLELSDQSLPSHPEEPRASRCAPPRNSRAPRNLSVSLESHRSSGAANVRHGRKGHSEDQASLGSDATLDLGKLSGLSLEAVRVLWSKHMGRAAPPVQKRLLIRELAWRTQERLLGGLDSETRRLLDRAIRGAIKDASSVSGIEAQPDETPETPRAAPKRLARGTGSIAHAAVDDLPPDARLTRTWRGVRYEVCVLDSGRGFRLRGSDRVYDSLSEIAREITGTRWSGPRFFGLTSRHESVPLPGGAPASDPYPRPGPGKASAPRKAVRASTVRNRRGIDEARA